MTGSIVLLCGLPACGKSTCIENDLHGHHYAIVLCPDDFRRVLTGKDFYAPAEDSVWSHVKVATRVLVAKGNPVLIDATNLTRGSRAQWVRIAKSLNVPISCILFDIPYEVCLERNKGRDRVVPEDIMQRMRDQFEIPTEDEGFTKIEIRKHESNE